MTTLASSLYSSFANRCYQETLNARSEYYTSQDDGTAEHRINQYVIKQEIGRGSFGAVHLATDQFGNEYVLAPAQHHLGYLLKKLTENAPFRL